MISSLGLLLYPVVLVVEEWLTDSEINGAAGHDVPRSDLAQLVKAGGHNIREVAFFLCWAFPVILRGF